METNMIEDCKVRFFNRKTGKKVDITQLAEIITDGKELNNTTVGDNIDMAIRFITTSEDSDMLDKEFIDSLWSLRDAFYNVKEVKTDIEKNKFVNGIDNKQ